METCRACFPNGLSSAGFAAHTKELPLLHTGACTQAIKRRIESHLYRTRGYASVDSVVVHCCIVSLSFNPIMARLPSGWGTEMCVMLIVSVNIHVYLRILQWGKLAIAAAFQ